MTAVEKERYWQELTKRFPRVPAELQFERGKARSRSMKHGTSILACRYSVDGEHILVAGGALPGWDSASCGFSADSGRETLICRAHVCGLYDIAVDPRSGFVATASEDYSVILGGGTLGHAGAQILANWPGLARLHSLSLGGTEIGTAGLKLLLASPHLGELIRLELQANDIEGHGAAAPAASPSVGRLQHLDLGNNYLLDEGVIALQNLATWQT